MLMLMLLLMLLFNFNAPVSICLPLPLLFSFSLLNSSLKLGPRKLIINKKKTRTENEFKLYVLSILMSCSGGVGGGRRRYFHSKFQQFNLIAYTCKSAAAAKEKQHENVMTFL